MRIETSVSAAALVFTVTAASAGQPILIDLGSLGGNYTSGFDINESGQVVGRSKVAGGDDHAFLYTGGVMIDLGTLGGDFSYALHVNDAGQVAGHSETAAGEQHAFLYSGGVMTDLGTLGGTSSYATAINPSGAVIGFSSTAGGEEHAFLYSGGIMTDLGTLGGTSSSARAINGAGVVVGTAWTGNGQQHAFRYAGGVMTDLGTLGGTTSAAFAINDAGDIVGESTTANGETHGFRYSGGVMTDLGEMGPGSITSALLINEAGDVAGTTNARPFFLRDGLMTAFGELGGWPTGMNEAGQVTGWAVSAGNRAYIFSRGAIADLGTLGGIGALPEAMNESGRVTGRSTNADEETRGFLRIPACGDGIADPTEECDDGNTASGDCCAGDCTYPGPATTCLDATDSVLSIKNESFDWHDRLQWRWRGSGNLVQADLGDPWSETTYTLCISDSTGGTDKLVSMMQIRPGSGWKSRDPYGWKFKGTSSFDHGIEKAKVAISGSGRASVRMDARRTNAPLPTPANGSELFDMDTRLTVQLFQDETAACWSAEFSGAEINTPGRFRAELP